ncbi:MAG: CBS domain-containing protein [Thiohalocapsa sp.]|nr:CBS domain-containing protein [Thiohalocapsa sp.]MCF7991320.1 CBS domain-containing protein [Thiohalocapsa sp.]
MQVRDYMSETPVTISAGADYQQAFDIMQERDLHHLPVVDADGTVVGILARRDLQLAARYFHEAPGEVEDVMHNPVRTIAPDADLADAVDMMTTQRIGCLPVSEDGGVHLVGIITETDLLRALRELLVRQAA